jgi:hypothetical protein
MSIMALSWSRISDYRQCPGKFRLKYIVKAPNFMLKDEDKSPALVRGGNIHKQLDAYVARKLKGEIIEISLPEVRGIIPLVDRIMDNYDVTSERQIAIDENFNEVSWYDKSTYFRVIYDLIGFGQDLLLGDYKTGKLTDYSGSLKELGQLHMAAVVGMSLWPKYEECSSAYIYVDHKQVIPCSFIRSEHYDQMKDKLMEEHCLINEDRKFDFKKNKYCGWCDAHSQQCSYSKK